MSFKNYAEKAYYYNMVKIGMPISLAVLVEFVAFNSIAIFMGRVFRTVRSRTESCLYINNYFIYDTVCYIDAIAVKVGFANGAKNIFDLKKYSLVGTVLSVGFMLFSALYFFHFHKIL